MEIDDAVALARRLMAEHGLDAWSLVLDSAKTRAGICRFDRQTIGLSRPLTALHGEAEVTDTVLHEIAHALVGPTHGHDRVWRATARDIGCSARRCMEGATRIEGSWTGTCVNGHVVTRHRRPLRVVSCSRCSPVFDPRAVFWWRHDGEMVPMHPRYEAELARLPVEPPLLALMSLARVG